MPRIMPQEGPQLLSSAETAHKSAIQAAYGIRAVNSFLMPAAHQKNLLLNGIFKEKAKLNSLILSMIRRVLIGREHKFPSLGLMS